LLAGILGVLVAQWALGAVVTLGADLISRAVEIRLIRAISTHAPFARSSL